MQEIVPGIHTWSWFSNEKGLDFNGFYVRGPVGSVIVDPPQYGADELARIDRFGAPQAIVITNGHHLRKARELAAHFGVPIRVHEADAGMIEASPDAVFHDGEALPGGMTAILIPDAKTPGETALHVPWASAIILGDALIGKPAGSLSLLPPEKIRDPVRARAGLRRLLEVPFDTILVGDGASILGRGKEALQEFLALPAGT